MTASYWGVIACEHWALHRPRRLAELEDPDTFFDLLEDEAAGRYAAIRDGLLDGLDPNNGTIGWTAFAARVDQANNVAREIVEAELTYFPGEDDEDQGDDW